jgi:Tfp pilus assembly protein PilO
MKGTSSTRTIVAILVVAGLAVAFWTLLLSPKRQEADDLAAQANGLQTSLSEAQSDLVAAEAARRQFPQNYRQLVVLGKAIPPDEDTSSLLVQLNHIGKRSKVSFRSLKMGTTDGSASTASPPPQQAPPNEERGEEGESGEGNSDEGESAEPVATVAPTEAAASLQPIGAQVGPAGLTVIPYDLTFRGNFFHVADVIKGLDSLVHTHAAGVAVDGRLLTLDGFALNADADSGFPNLDATFSVTSYQVPPDQGITAGATEAGPAEATPVSTTTSGSPR